MDILNTIAANGLTPSLALVAVCMVVVYLWKVYQSYINKTSEGIGRNYNAVKEVQQLVKAAEDTNKTLNNEIFKLQSVISDLEKRLSDLEKLDIKANADLALIIKEIENIRKNMETYQMLTALRGHVDDRKL